MSEPLIPEELVTFIAAIAEDDGLRAWLLGLRSKAMSDRNAELGEMAEQMRAGGEDPVTIAAITALTRPALFDAACRTVEELPAS